MKIIATLCITIIPSCLLAQGALGGNQAKGIDINLHSGGFITEIKSKPQNIQGNVFMDEQWFVGNINFIDGSSLHEKPIRYNILSDLIEIRIGDTFKATAGSNVSAFEINRAGVTETYVHAKTWLSSADGSGFFKVLVTGHYELYEKINIKIVQGSYVAALDMGDKEVSYTRTIEYYMWEGKQFQRIKLSRKHFAATFPEKKDLLLAFLKKNDINLKNPEDLQRTVRFMNGEDK